jgi:hypothetical protein
MKRHNKSSEYQHVYYEIGMDPHRIFNLASKQTPEIEANYTVLDLEDELIVSIKKLFIHLTDHQRTVINYTLAGYTQHEIGNILGCTQSAVHKSLNGNEDYQNKKNYGGTVKKLLKFIYESPECISIINEINIAKNPDVELKYCYACKLILHPSFFVRDSSRRDGKNNKCRRCAHEYLRQYSKKKRRRARAASINTIDDYCRTNTHINNE